jgi:hypothetical protein
MTTELIFTIAAVITALGVIFGGVYSVYRIVKRIGDVLGTDADGRSITDRLSRVEHQLWENGGSSLADRVNNIETHVLKATTEIEIIKSFVVGSAQPAVVPPITKVTRTRKKAS